MKPRWSDKELIEAVQESISIRQVLIRLNLAPYGGSYGTIHRNIKRLDLNTSHFLGKRANKGKAGKQKNIDEYLVLNGPQISTYHLKTRLLKLGYLENECYICEISEWMGKPLSLHLDHINGNKRDNRIENLQMLCPNCHSQTDTYCSKNAVAKY